MSHLCHLESTVVVFNMALAYLLCDTDTCRIKAISLFDMAVSLALAAPRSPLYSSIAMAGLNNVGVIYFSLCQYRQSRGYLDTLHAYILTLPHIEDHEAMKERHHILLNTIMLKEPAFAGAA
jgi:hypothetical protein